MPSHLEDIPLDVLTQVAFFTIDSSPTSALGALLQLMLCCRNLHRHLSIDACPQLYARIFRAKFDLVGYCRREREPRTTSCLASELRVRQRVLRRIRLGEVVAHCLLDDLWVVYLMLLESDGLNELHLHAVGVGNWVLSVLRELHTRASNEIGEHAISLAVSVASLVLSHIQISSLPMNDRNQVLNLLRPFTTSVPKYLSANVNVVDELGILSTSGSRNRAPGRLTVPSKDSREVDKYPTKANYLSRFTIPFPNLLSSAVFLTFAFKEVTPLQIPPHLPPTRAVAIATERHGPTMADFVAITRRRTPLVADSFLQYQSRESDPDLAKEQRRPSRSVIHDEDFYRTARRLHAPTETWELQAYIPGLLTGVWEGSYMVAPSTSCPPIGCPGLDVSQDFLCRQPIQFRLEEYLSFTPWLPLPVETQDNFDGHVLRNLCANEEESTSIIQFSDGNPARNYPYEPFRLNGASESGRDPQHALDVVITGETPRRFEAAWGAYSFIGRIRLSDGLISLTRKPKNAGDDGCGTWVFEGYLHSRRTFVGKWGTLSALGQEGIGGIFSVSKTAD
ncbi:hypothetical protein PAXRUDRAFT_684849 [Paxillus rubicundulus Ve08.2h10]|uniref:F-box domain-containing protein n=1 Tax=Paxillus rubicundulus Ve08.2h10 TaxID=930991 RepID=A0A0D0E8F5_9AGAM|nr:hypothetical protein PAXRUDRAFT_684849 [Paxillus rubicundulus Ve08.2h10]